MTPEEQEAERRAAQEAARRAAQKAISARKLALLHLLNPVSKQELARAVAATEAKYAAAQQIIKETSERRRKLDRLVEGRLGDIDAELQRRGASADQRAAVREPIKRAVVLYKTDLVDRRTRRRGRGRPVDVLSDWLTKDIQRALEKAGLPPPARGRNSGLTSVLVGIARGAPVDRRLLGRAKKIVDGAI